MHKSRPKEQREEVVEGSGVAVLEVRKWRSEAVYGFLSTPRVREGERRSELEPQVQQVDSPPWLLTIMPGAQSELRGRYRRRGRGGVALLQEVWDGTRQVRILGSCMAPSWTRARRRLPQVRSGGQGMGVPGMQTNKAEGSFYRVHVDPPPISKNTLPCLQWGARSEPVQPLQDAEDEGQVPVRTVEASQ